jgi:hypothetical protein
MTRTTIALGLLASGMFWLTCSAAPEVLPPSMFLTPRPRSIDDQGQVSNITIYVADSKGAPRSGQVTLNIRAGAFGSGGKSATLDLDEGGHANIDWSCRRSLDPGCAGDVRLEARWESGSEFLVQVVRIEVGPPDAGQVDGGGSGDGGSGVDAGQGIPLDPQRVLVLGTMSEGACYRDVLADPTRPTEVSVGFPCYTSSPKLQGSSLLYLDLASNTLYRFVRDRFTRTTPTTPWAYPADTTANDTVVVTAGCAGVQAFWPGPDGKLLYQCAATNEYRLDSVVVTLPSGGSPLSLGEGGVALLSVFSTVTLLAADGGVVAVTLADGGSLDRGPARWAGDGGFLVAPKVLSGLTRSLFRVSVDGTAALVGDYPAEPTDFTPGFAEALDGTGRMVVMGRSTSTSGVDQIAEFPLAPGASSIIYNEGNATPVDLTGATPQVYMKLHISELVTGP